MRPGDGLTTQLYFNEVGRVERDLERDVRRWTGGLLLHRLGDAPPEEIKLAQLVRGDRLEDGSRGRSGSPEWLKEEDLDFYAGGIRTHRLRIGHSTTTVRPTLHGEGNGALPRCNRFTVPACFVAGDRDLVILMNDEIYRGMPKEVPQLRTKLAAARMRSLDQQERPEEETTRAMLEFLETTAVGSSGKRR